MTKTKSIKTSEWVHKELKIFAAKEGISAIQFTDAAIVALMRLRGHKFTAPKQQPKSKKP